MRLLTSTPLRAPLLVATMAACSDVLAPDVATTPAVIVWLEARWLDSALSVRAAGYTTTCSGLARLTADVSPNRDLDLADVVLEARARLDDGTRCLVPVSFDTVVPVAVDMTRSAAAVYVQSGFTLERRQFLFANRYAPSVLIRYVAGYVVADTAAGGCLRLRADVPNSPLIPYAPLDPPPIPLVPGQSAFVRGTVSEGDGVGCGEAPVIRLLTLEFSLPARRLGWLQSRGRRLTTAEPV